MIVIKVVSLLKAIHWELSTYVELFEKKYPTTLGITNYQTAVDVQIRPFT